MITDPSSTNTSVNSAGQDVQRLAGARVTPASPDEVGKADDGEAVGQRPKKHWRKSWADKWRDEASEELDAHAKALRALLGDLAELEDGSDVGWALDARGQPHATRRLARLLSLTEAQTEDAIRQLIEVGVAVRRGGRVGLLHWRASQENPSAKRKRSQRAQAAGAERDTDRDMPRDTERDMPRDSHGDCHAQRTEDRGQRTEDSEDTEQRPEASPARTGAAAPPPPAQAIRPTGNVDDEGPTSAPASLERALVQELSLMFVPSRPDGAKDEARRIKASDPQALKLAEPLLRVPLKGLDQEAARRMRSERLQYVLDIVRKFADICREDPAQARFWAPTMLGTTARRGKDHSPWEVVEAIVAERADRRAPRGAASSRASLANMHGTGVYQPLGNDRQYSTGRQEF